MEAAGEPAGSETSLEPGRTPGAERAAVTIRTREADEQDHRLSAATSRRFAKDAAVRRQELEPRVKLRCSAS
jgi:hypothetical protein